MFAPELQPCNTELAVWQVLLVDDDADIHAYLRLALDGMVVEGRALHLISAYSAEQAKTVLAEYKELALVLLDVVMETPQAGLLLARYIREELNNKLVQIVLVTGQPGYAPQREVVMKYDINGYQLKSSLTVDRVFSTVYTAIRNYAGLLKLLHQQKLLDEAERREHQDRMFKTFIVESSEDAIIGMTLGGTVTSWNQAAQTIFGYSAQEILDGTLHALIPPERCEEDQKVMASILQGEVISLFESERIRKDGKKIPVFLTVSPIRDAEGNTVGISQIVRDITERKQAETKLRLAANVFTHAREAILITEIDGTIIDVNDTFSRITGYSREEVLGKNPRLLNSGRQSSEFYAAMWKELHEKGHWYGEMWNRRKDGELYAQTMSISAVHDVNGAAMHYVALCMDITLMKKHEKQLEHIAHYDVLTNLPNRTLLADRLQQGMNLARRSKHRLGVVYLDLDGFKAVNDKYGHDLGDQFLMILSSKMEHALREGDTLSRIGGDEFVAVLTDIDSIEGSFPLVNRMLAIAAQPISIEGHQVQVSASIGMAFYPQEQEVDADQLMRQADQAMYQAKLSGKNRYHAFDVELDSHIRTHHESQERIRQALLEQEFILYYQPKVNMRTGEVVGAEALIRWQHPEKGLLPPVLFLPIIENHQVAVEIGEWVIETALIQQERWQAAGLDIPVSVNIGARQLQQSDFVDRIRSQLAAHPNVRPACLELEVLETSALEDIAKVSATMAACRELGVNFALDDFGTGYSSLTYLKRLPVALLKIDQSFVRDMLDDPDDLSILEGVLDLAIAFRRDVIAEGVETIAHGELLLQLGCQLAQGYGIARPMPPHEFVLWATNWRPAPSWALQNQITRDKLPLLYACVEHRAWIAKITRYLKDEYSDARLFDYKQCHFGRWLDADTALRYGTLPALQKVRSVHQQMHDLSEYQMKLHAKGQPKAALEKMGELLGLQDALLAQLAVLMGAH